MTNAEARIAILQQLGRTSLYELRMPGSSAFYPDEEIVKILARRVGGDVEDYVRSTNNLSRASLAAAVDNALRERITASYRGARRRRSGTGRRTS